MALALATALALTTAGFPGAAFAAGPAESFLKRLEGSWRGSGSALIPGRRDPERISCRVTNKLEGDALEVEGECASTQGKTPVSGRLTATGNTVGGTLINAFKGATMTRTTGAVDGERLVVSSSFVNDATGQLTRTRQVILAGSGNFVAEFFTYNSRSGSYEPAGQISFKAQ